MPKKIATSTAVAALLVISVAPAAYATYSYSGYSTTVGKFNGSGYTGTQTKSDSDTPAELVSSTVGGNYKVDACLVASGSSLCLLSPWVRVDDNSTYQIKNAAGGGSTVRVRFSNDLLTRVNVQVDGKWRAR